MSLEEVLVEVEIVANCKLGDKGSQLGLLGEGGGEKDIAQGVLIAKNGNVWRTTPRNGGRRRMQDIMTPPGVTYC